MYQATATIPTLNQGPTLAPQLEQGRRETDPKTSKPFNEWIKGTTEKLERLNSEVWRELHLTWLLIDLFIEGKHMLRRRHRGFGFDVIPMPDTTASSVREQNKLGFFSRVLQSKWVASRTKINGVPGDDTEESAAVARLVGKFMKAVEPLVYSEWFRQREALGGQTCGAYARYFHFDPNADGGYADEPIIEEQQVKFGEDAGECLECGYAGGAGEFGYGSGAVGAASGGEFLAGRGGDIAGAVSSAGMAGPGPEPVPDSGVAGAMGLAGPANGVVCPDCGSSLVQIDEMPVTMVQNVTGYQKRKLGNLRGESVPYTRLRHEISTTLEDSPWMRWRQRLRIEQIKQMYPHVKLGPFDSQTRDSGLEVEDAIQRTVGGYQNTALLGYWSKDRAQYGEITHWWLKPAMYHDYVFPMDTPTNEVDPETGQPAMIPAGTKAIDVYPDGMHFILLSGVDQPVVVENDAHTDHWVSAPYHLRFLAGVGIGINDAVEMQRQWNVVLGLVFTHIRTAALPGWLYDKDTISPDEVRKLGQPQMSVPASLRNKPENTRLEQLVYQMAPGQIPSHIPWYIGQLDANMQTIAGALIDEGVPGTNSKTATGTIEMVQASQQHNSPEFALKGDADVRSADVMIKLAKKHMPEERFLAIGGKWGRYETMKFSSADLDSGVFRLEAKRDSWLPNTRASKQEGIEKVLMLAGGVQGLVEMQNAAPDLLDQLEEAYDVTIHGDTYSANVILCRQRIDQIKQQAPMFEQMAAGIAPMVDPETGAVTDPLMMLAEEVVNALRPPIEMEEPGHLLSIEYLRPFLITDEGKEASDLERACVKAMIRRHLQSEMMVQQTMAMMQMAAMPPMPEEEGANGQPQPKKTDKDKRKDSARANVNPKPKNPAPQSKQRAPAMAG